MSKQSLKAFLEDNSKKSRLIDIVLKNYYVIESEAEVRLADCAQWFDERWMAPAWGCNTLQKLIDEIEAMK